MKKGTWNNKTPGPKIRKIADSIGHELKIKMWNAFEKEAYIMFF